MGIRIAGIGSYAPDRILTNADLEKMVDTTDEWITTRTGIRERHIAEATVRDRRYSRYCVMGVQSDRDVKYAVRDDTIHIYGSVEEFFRNTVEERKKRAIAKLTDDDLDALGLTR